jgi:beta-glucosidase/6-phospho-beta-glucosidase/beta-galactosidase
LQDLLCEVYERYRRPMLITETGAEGGAKPYWLHYVCGEVQAAMNRGVPIEGVCLYPVLDYHGWDNDRVCAVGLLSLADEQGRRRVCPLLSTELQAQRALLQPGEKMSAMQNGVQYG